MLLLHIIINSHRIIIDAAALRQNVALCKNAVGIFLWRYATVVLETTVKVRHIVEAHHIADLSQRELALTKQIASAVNAKLVKIRNVSLSRSLLEECAERRTVHAHMLSNHIDGYLTGIIVRREQFHLINTLCHAVVVRIASHHLGILLSL